MLLLQELLLLNIMLIQLLKKKKEKQPLTAATQVAFKNCAPFKDCRTVINDTFVNYADFINIAMPMYNLIRYSDNYSDSSGSLRG